MGFDARLVELLTGDRAGSSALWRLTTRCGSFDLVVEKRRELELESISGEILLSSP